MKRSMLITGEIPAVVGRGRCGADEGHTAVPQADIEVVTRDMNEPQEGT